MGIRHLPAGVKLTPKQEIQRQAVVNGRPHIDRPALATFLRRLNYPLHFLDFETFAPAIPMFDGDVASTPTEAEAIARRIGGTVVIKAQVHAGGRGKAGGVKLARNPAEAADEAAQILGMTIKGITVRKVLVAAWLLAMGLGDPFQDVGEAIGLLVTLGFGINWH